MSLTREQAWLLRAALLEGEEAQRAWRAWRSTAGLETIDRGSTRLLPLLWHNLLANGIDDPWLARFKGVYRHTWFGNQLRVRRLREIQAALAGNGVGSVVLKGIALACAYYPNPGLRPMDDLDLLVAPADVPAALAALGGAGWTVPLSRPERVLEVVHGVELRAADGERLDLHGHLFQGTLQRRLDALRRGRAELVELADGPLRVLAPTDQLLHVLVHGVESDPPAPRWLADALMILRRRGTDIDWPQLRADAAAEGRGLALRRALAQLEQVFAAALPVPAEQLADARRRSSSAIERIEHRVAAGAPLFAIGYLLRRWVDYRRWRRVAADLAAPAETARRQSITFAGYLRLNWGLDSLAQLPGQVVRRGLRSSREDIGRALARLRPPAGAADEPSRQS